MNGRAGIAVALGAVTVLVVSSAAAQRRDGGAATGVYQINLETAARFGDITVPAHRYRLTLSSEAFALADLESMVLVATVPVQRTTMQESVSRPTVKVERMGETVTILLRYGDEEVRAIGTVVEATAPTDRSLVTLAGKKERILDEGGPSRASDSALVRKALNRYLRSVKHCAEAAHRGRWKTDDPRFVRCICPILAKWRLPKVEKRLRVHQPLSKGRFGFSFSVTEEGKTDSCRVWVGASPPPEPKVAPEPNPEVPPTPDASPAPAEPADAPVSPPKATP